MLERGCLSLRSPCFVTADVCPKYEPTQLLVPFSTQRSLIQGNLDELGKALIHRRAHLVCAFDYQLGDSPAG